MLIDNYLGEYVGRIRAALFNIDKVELQKAYDCIQNGIEAQKTFFVCGNGGSASTSEHFVCDHMKGTSTNTNLNPKFYSLTCNTPLLTALANDVGYDHVFSWQLKQLAKPDDVLIVITASGNSPNIVEVIKESKREKNMTVIALTGFDGGYAKDNSDISLYVDAHNYGIAEDCHQILMHSLFQCISINNTVDNKKLRL